MLVGRKGFWQTTRRLAEQGVFGDQGWLRAEQIAQAPAHTGDDRWLRPSCHLFGQHLHTGVERLLDPVHEVREQQNLRADDEPDLER